MHVLRASLPSCALVNLLPPLHVPPRLPSATRVALQCLQFVFAARYHTPSSALPAPSCALPTHLLSDVSARCDEPCLIRRGGVPSLPCACALPSRPKLPPPKLFAPLPPSPFCPVAPLPLSLSSLKSSHAPWLIPRGGAPFLQNACVSHGSLLRAMTGGILTWTHAEQNEDPSHASFSSMLPPRPSVSVSLLPPHLPPPPPPSPPPLTPQLPIPPTWQALPLSALLPLSPSFPVVPRLPSYASHASLPPSLSSLSSFEPQPWPSHAALLSPPTPPPPPPHLTPPL